MLLYVKDNPAHKWHICDVWNTEANSLCGKRHPFRHTEIVLPAGDEVCKKCADIYAQKQEVPHV